MHLAYVHERANGLTFQMGLPLRKELYFIAILKLFYCYHIYFYVILFGKNPYFNPIIIFYQNRESYFIHVLFYFIPIFLDDIIKIAYFEYYFLKS